MDEIRVDLVLRQRVVRLDRCWLSTPGAAHVAPLRERLRGVPIERASRQTLTNAIEASGICPRRRHTPTAPTVSPGLVDGRSGKRPGSQQG
ncbi:hypothetical protein [Micromonospora sp. MH33]|uniref:hypothetical protein n=1 Tax=Micromonospora sp. MH33 TaxID=1945509 RepID=UPI00143DD82B|nr:hypothetical protein [Micromonospora sp. MH33]